MTLLITYRHEVTCTIQEDAVDVIEAERGIKLASILPVVAIETEINSDIFNNLN